MIFICAQPATIFYAWQVEVMLDSFIRNGVSQEDVHIVCAKGPEYTYYPGWEKLATKYSNASFFFYDDTRKDPGYASSIRPNILKQHFKKNPYLKNETIFYHDCDIVLTKSIDWDKFMGDDSWYGSNCCDYLGYNHILEKGGDILNKMCEVSNIDPNVVKINQENSIGAQYVLKGIDNIFWKNVEVDSNLMHSEISQMNRKKIEDDPLYNPLVIYCADMWALLWNGWKIGKKTICHSDLSFCWAPRNKVDFEIHSIFHNAGIQHDMQEEYFYKYNYLNRLPYFDELSIRENTSSYEYWKEIKKTGENTVLF